LMGRYAARGPKHTFHSVKRFIGRTADDRAVRIRA
jgi:molecular chaperone DnaK (HSP70)